jgi:hypothetical protein
MSPDSTNMRKKALVNMGESLPKLVLPVSDTEDTNNEFDDKHPTSPASKSQSNVNLPYRNQRHMSSPLLRRLSAPPPSLEDRQKEIEGEEVLRREYEQKTAYVPVFSHCSSGSSQYFIFQSIEGYGTT